MKDFEIRQHGNIFIAIFKGSDGGTFQGAGKTKEEAESVMWTQYNKYYG